MGRVSLPAVFGLGRVRMIDYFKVALSKLEKTIETMPWSDLFPEDPNSLEYEFIGAGKSPGIFDCIRKRDSESLDAWEKTLMLLASRIKDDGKRRKAEKQIETLRFSAECVMQENAHSGWIAAQAKVASRQVGVKPKHRRTKSGSSRKGDNPTSVRGLR